MEMYSDIQRGKRGLAPVRSAVVRDEGGVPCSTNEAQNPMAPVT